MEKERKKQDVNLVFRNFDFNDIDGVLEVANKLTGSERPEYWKKRFSEYLSLDPMGSIVAETDEKKIIGFILGHVRGWETGLGEIGWIEIFGIDPEYQGQGIGHRLLDELIQYFKSLDVKIIYTLVSREQIPMQIFLMRHNFSHADHTPLKLELE
jgi:ribosomal protein S18 acetylase RimI-like enzyme